MTNITALNVPILKNISQEHIAPYENSIYLLKSKKDDIICDALLSDVKNCYFILSGKARIVQIEKEGDCALTYMIHPSMGFGFEHLIEENEASKPSCHLIATALEDTSLCVISRGVMQKMLKIPEITKNFCSFLLSMQYHVSDLNRDVA